MLKFKKVTVAIALGTALLVLGGCASNQSAPAAAAAKAEVKAPVLYHGEGIVANYRDNNAAKGPNHDNLNVTTASVVFDQAGKIVDLKMDVLEITPEEFPGWMDPKAADAAKAPYLAGQKDGFGWKSKLDEGNDYGMKAAAVSKKEWYEQMAFYQNYFKGKTVAEIKDWAKKYTDVNGRPFKFAYPDKMTADDKAKTANFTDAEKKMLTDVTTGATMSLQDVHSRFLDALTLAEKHKVEIK